MLASYNGEVRFSGRIDPLFVKRFTARSNANQVQTHSRSQSKGGGLTIRRAWRSAKAPHCGRTRIFDSERNLNRKFCNSHGFEHENPLPITRAVFFRLSCGL